MSGTITTYIDGTAVSPTFTTPASLSFRDLIGHTPDDNFGWYGKQVAADDRLQLWTGYPQRCEAGTLKITVKPGDNPIGSTGERNEILEMLNSSGDDENGASGTQYYSISIFLPGTWKDASGWCSAFQLHGPDTGLPSNQGSPVFSLDLSSTPGHYTLRQNGGDTSDVIRKDTDLGAHVYNQWVDFLFKVTWAIDLTGETTVWTRVGSVGQLQQKLVDAGNNGAALAAWNTATLYSSGGVAVNHYWKRGCYRSAEDFTTEFYASPVSRSIDFASAAWAAFGQYP